MAILSYNNNCRQAQKASMEAYSLQGIACYANVPEEIIYEVASGCNANPSLMLSRKIIDFLTCRFSTYFLTPKNRVFA